MRLFYTSLILLWYCSSASAQNCSNCDVTPVGQNAVTVPDGNQLCITSNYSGTITFSGSGSICLSNNAVFNGSLDLNNANSKTVNITVNSGSAFQPSNANGINSCILTLKNYGTTVFSGSVVINHSGTNGYVQNFSGGTLNSAFIFNPNSYLINDGVLNQTGARSLDFKNPSSFNNSGTANIDALTLGDNAGAGNPVVVTNSKSISINTLSATNRHSLTNTSTATINIVNSASYDNGTWDNAGVITGSSFAVGNNAGIINRKRIKMTGTITVNGTANNTGIITSTSNITFNTSNSNNQTNNCAIISNGDININTPGFENNGFVWASNSQFVVNGNGSLTMKPSSVIRGTSFSNSATVIGSGSLYFTGQTTNNGVFGDGSAPDINFYDDSQTPNQIFDNQPNAGTNIKADVYRSAFTAPDTVNTAPSGCTYNNNAVLPVKLVYFSAVKKGRDVLVSWQSAVENNFKNYELERSGGTGAFSLIASLAPDRVSTGAKDYSFFDMSPMPGAYLYRLKMIDNDGSSGYSPVAQVNINYPGNVAVSPNPFTEAIRVSLPSGLAGFVQLTIQNVLGDVVKSNQYNIASGAASLKVEGLESLPSGLYNLRLQTTNEAFSIKLVKK